MIPPHTLIINHFYSRCRGDLQIALTKQNFLDTSAYHNYYQIANKGYLQKQATFIFYC